MAEKNVTARHEKYLRFAESYVTSLNATEAAIAAGVPEKSAATTGHAWLRRSDVQGYVAAVRQRVSKEMDITQRRVLGEFAKIAFVDPVKTIDEKTGAVIKLHDMDEDTRRAIQSIEVEEIRAGGAVVGVIQKVKFWPKHQALQSLANHLDLFNPDRDKSGALGLSDHELDRQIEAELAALDAIEKAQRKTPA